MVEASGPSGAESHPYVRVLRHVPRLASSGEECRREWRRRLSVGRARNCCRIVTSAMGVLVSWLVASCWRVMLSVACAVLSLAFACKCFWHGFSWLLSSRGRRVRVGRLDAQLSVGGRRKEDTDWLHGVAPTKMTTGTPPGLNWARLGDGGGRRSTRIRFKGCPPQDNAHNFACTSRTTPT